MVVRKPTYKKWWLDFQGIYIYTPLYHLKYRHFKRSQRPLGSQPSARSTWEGSRASFPLPCSAAQRHQDPQWAFALPPERNGKSRECLWSKNKLKWRHLKIQNGCWKKSCQQLILQRSIPAGAWSLFHEQWTVSNNTRLFSRATQGSSFYQKACDIMVKKWHTSCL